MWSIEIHNRGVLFLKTERIEKEYKRKKEMRPSKRGFVVFIVNIRNGEEVVFRREFDEV